MPNIKRRDLRPNNSSKERLAWAGRVAAREPAISAYLLANAVKHQEHAYLLAIPPEEIAGNIAANAEALELPLEDFIKLALRLPALLHIPSEKLAARVPLIKEIIRHCTPPREELDFLHKDALFLLSDDQTFSGQLVVARDRLIETRAGNLSRMPLATVQETIIKGYQERMVQEGLHGAAGKRLEELRHQGIIPGR
jgi:hypothetical protein